MRGQSLVLAGVLALLVVAIVSALAVAQLKVHFIDVGQGDAILIDYGEYELLIDGGRGRACSEYIADLVDGELEVVVATHMDADHIGGLVYVFEELDVGELWTNGNSATTDIYGAFKVAYETEGCPLYVARAGDIIWLDNLPLEVLHPRVLGVEPNDNSIVLLTGYAAWYFLFTGDITSAVERDLLEAGVLDDIDILKVAHHGSAQSTCSEFLEAITPLVSVISVGGNPYGHPSDDVMRRIACYEGESYHPSSRLIYRTDLYGSVIVLVKGMFDVDVSTSSGIDTPWSTCIDLDPSPSPCNCYSGDTLNCGDFPCQSAAQDCYDYCMGLTGQDVHGLDGDNDGLACESLPKTCP